MSQYTRFVFSHLRTFCRQIHRCTKSKEILAMPGLKKTPDTEIAFLPSGWLRHRIITKYRMMSAVLMMTMTKTMTLTVAYHYHRDHGDQRGFGTGCDWCGHVGTPTRWSSNTNIRTNTNTNGNISTNTNTITIQIHRDHGDQRGVGTGCDWCGHLGTLTDFTCTRAL